MNANAVHNATVCTNAEPLPGYVVTERIGAGGYGEVWKATAPGGVDKAVKTLFGYHDEDLASRELKSLELIKGVRHPFLLSLDRFEVVDGRLVVVTELADMSLDQCFQIYRRKGKNGIAREELLGYLRDAADALDYMQASYGLQHLDVKPENLLLVGGHVKVADFGLVKEVERHTQNSLVGGMTPTYAAPELFDGRPSSRSDQYSLAIVYQEMLTGSLPFPGRTPAQLVAQHVQGRPRVSPLPAEDRGVILRALAKKADDRFASCTEFVAALASCSPTSQQPVSASQVDGGSCDDRVGTDDTRDSAANCTQRIPPEGSEHVSACTEQIDRSGGEACAPRDTTTEPTGGSGGVRRIAKSPPPRPALAIQRKPTPSTPESALSESVADKQATLESLQTSPPRRTLLIGAGGAGNSVLLNIRKQLLETDADAPWRELAPMLAVDTDAEELKSLRQRTADAAPSLIDTLFLPLKRPQQYRDRSSELLQWLSRRWLYNIPRSLKTRGYRPLGRLALVDNAKTVVAELRRKLTALLECDGDATDENGPPPPDGRLPPRVTLVASTGGGTGSGVSLDLAVAIRGLAAELGRPDLEIVGVFGDCHGRSGDAGNLAMANSHSFLTELSSLTRRGNRGRGPSTPSTEAFESDCSPFDHVYFVGSTEDESTIDGGQWINQAALYLATDVSGGDAGFLNFCRSKDAEVEDDDEVVRIRSFAAAPLDDSSEVIAQVAQERICRLVADNWRQASAAATKESAAATEASRAKEASPKKGKAPPPDAQELFEADLAARLERSVEAKFGDAATGSFAVSLVSIATERLAEKREALSGGDEAALPKLIHRLATQAVSDLNDVVSRFNRGTDGDAVVSSRCLGAEAEMTEQERIGETDEDASRIAESVSRVVCRDYFAGAIASKGNAAPDLAELLWRTAGEALRQQSSEAGWYELILRIAGPGIDISKTIQATVMRPKRCGHSRRSVVLAPQNWPIESLENEVHQLLPQASFVQAPVPRPILLREATDVALAQVAARLAEQTPEIAEAAARLHARADVTWERLPHVVSRDDA
ncbi:MAG: tubulin-like doman-containing protein [Planctomycetota bacterium]